MGHLADQRLAVAYRPAQEQRRLVQQLRPLLRVLSRSMDDDVRHDRRLLQGNGDAGLRKKLAEKRRSAKTEMEDEVQVRSGRLHSVERRALDRTHLFRRWLQVDQ